HGGGVLDAEALQNSDKDLSRAAIEMVRSTSFPPSGFQQEAFINVQFHMPAATLDGPPIFHSRVRWMIWDRRGKVPPVRRAPPNERKQCRGRVRGGRLARAAEGRGRPPLPRQAFDRVTDVTEISARTGRGRHASC